MEIGVIGGDGKKTIDVFKQIEDSGLGTIVWHVPARTGIARLHKLSADIFICLVDFCGHGLSEVARQRAQKLGAIYRQMSISKSQNNLKLEAVVQYVKEQVMKTLAALREETGLDYVSKQEACALGVGKWWFAAFEEKYHTKRVPFGKGNQSAVTKYPMCFYLRADVLSFLEQKGVVPNVESEKDMRMPDSAALVTRKPVRPVIAAPMRDIVVPREMEKPFNGIFANFPQLLKEHGIAVPELPAEYATVDVVPVVTPVVAPVVTPVAAPLVINRPALFKNASSNGFHFMSNLESVSEQDIEAEAQLLIDEDLKQSGASACEYTIMSIAMSVKARRITVFSRT